MLNEDEPVRCRPKHFFCFFMCYDVPSHMAHFMWLVALIGCTIGLFAASHAIARSYGFENQFSVIIHMFPLILLAMAHVPFLGLRYGDLSTRRSDENISPLMMRILAAGILGMSAFCFATSITVDRWWSDPMSEQMYVYGPGPQHASPSATPEPANSNGGGIIFKSASKTPSQTPSQSPNPSIRAAEFQESSDRRSVVGAVYMSSIFCGLATLMVNYLLRTIPQIRD